ncbi:hypothetical protein B296_00022522 [Ensete ventricosum]|uniref:Amino acid transporter transmembrane domain-containing protein n=1 Tax=Ensete ventricosum TaxID=4639 RepID=A0A427ATB4_ENSVE|nr:hypothetical protein B296_00022522 [Ensete ventricosum]
MPQQKQAEEAAIAASGITTFDNETEQGGGGKVEEDETASVFSMKNLLWHGGSAWDAWFSCASNQVLDSSQTTEDSDSSKGVVFSADGLEWLVWGIGGDFAGGAGAVDATVLLLAAGDAVRGDPSAVLRLPRKLDCLPHQRTVHRVPHPKGEGKRQLQEPRYPAHRLRQFWVFDLVRGSNIYYINDRLDKRTWTYIFGACCATTVFIPSFHNYRIWSFIGLGMTTYTAWYLTVAAAVHGQVEGVVHSGPTKFVLYFTGATNILYTFGGHAVTV